MNDPNFREKLLIGSAENSQDVEKMAIQEKICRFMGGGGVVVPVLLL